MKQKQEPIGSITIDVLGDLCLAWYSLEKEEYIKVVDKINNCFGKVDYRIANLESPFLYDENPHFILKEGENSNLGTNKKYIDFIKYLDIDAYTLANNHLGDLDEKGVKDTIITLANLNKQYVGTSLEYKNTYKPLRVEIGNYRISFISVCENEFGIAKDGKIGAAGFSYKIMKEVIREENKWASLKIVIFHGGTEHYPFPTPNQKQRYHWLIDMGVEIVIGMHQHCPVGYEYYQDSLIVYGLGNFFFPRKNFILYENWNVGYMVRLFIRSDYSIAFQPIPFMFDMDGKKFQKIDMEFFENYFTEISKPIEKDEKLVQLYNGWVSYSGKKHYDLLKHCISNDKNIYFSNIIKNLMTCEAHNELLTTYLNLRYYKPCVDYKEVFKKIQRCINIHHYGVMQNNENTNMLKKVEKYVLWGVGQKAEKIYKELQRKECEISIIDNDIYKQGFYFFESKIEPPDSLIGKNADAIYYICTSTIHINTIKSYLISLGISECKILNG